MEDTATAGRLFQEALASEVQLSAHTVNRLINQLGRSGQLEEAVRVVTTLTSKGFAADKFTFTALLNACQRVNAGELAFTIWRCGNLPIRVRLHFFAGVASCRRFFHAGSCSTCAFQWTRPSASFCYAHASIASRSPATMLTGRCATC